MGDLSFHSRADLVMRLWDREDVAHHYGVSRQSISNWLKRDDFPRPLTRLGGGTGAMIWLREDFADWSPPVHKLCTETRIVAAMQEFARRYGRPPTATDFNVARLKAIGDMEGFARFYEDGCYPHATSVYGNGNAFPSWADAVEAAGFRRPEPGRYEKPGKRVYRREADVDGRIEVRA